MRRFLIIAPEALAQAGTIGATLLDQGDYYDTILPVERFASWSPLTYPGIPGAPGSWSGLIVLGGAMSANDVEGFPFLGEIEALMRAFDAASLPVLGVCLGAQIAARAFGGAVSPMGALETGFVSVALTDAARDDPVFGGSGTALTMFQNHYDAVRHCADAVVLATGGMCPIQAFRVGERVYATQFHMEVTLDGARDWFRHFGAVLYRDAPRMEQELDPSFVEHFAAQRTACRRLVQRWSALAPDASGLERRSAMRGSEVL